ncbi:MAG: glycosyltransferase family 2 protein [Desulfovibrionaceae bacterium]|nr:glycosyltransferase family 2 protein [Desulfovibrionaceae bacterium]
MIEKNADPAGLRQAFPCWPLGVEEIGVRNALAGRAAGLAAGDAAWLPLARAIGCWAWARQPLDSAALANVRALDDSAGFLPEKKRGFLDHLAERLQGPGPGPEWGALLASGEHALALRRLLPGLRDPASGPAWLAAGWDYLLRLGRPDLPLAMIEALAEPGTIAPLIQRLKAEWAFFYADPDQALDLLQALDQDLFGTWSEYMSAEVCLKQGAHARGIELLSRAWRAFPLHPHLTLKLHCLLNPEPDPGRITEDVGCCVLIYSWNKAGPLAATLKNLADTDTGRARIVVLNNGSTDGSAEVIESAARLFPEGLFRAVSLPINVGAPAARNWLLSLPEVRAGQFAAFLDDDVILPQDWLARLLGAARSRPGAGSVGCRIVSADEPAALQSADYGLLPPAGRKGGFRDLAERVFVFDNCAGALDSGLFTYCRPALSVSGCCHLLSMASVQEAGGFDIRFSPTQFDDLERDLRQALAGFESFYAGDLRVRHIQHSSLARARTVAAAAQVMGNKIKLEGLFEAKEVEGLAEQGLDRLWADLKARWQDLEAAR